MKNKELSKHIIVGNGEFPQHHIPISALCSAETIICCDGAANTLYKNGITPHVVIGDLDSILPEVAEAYAHVLVCNTDQDINDQTKAIEWALTQGLQDVLIIGASGKREDHTIGNIALLAEYGKKISAQICTDYGIFTPIYHTHRFDSFVGQQVSIFTIGAYTPVSSKGLRYPLQNMKLDSWWKGTLNEASETSFEIVCDAGELIVFTEHAT